MYDAKMALFAQNLFEDSTIICPVNDIRPVNLPPRSYTKREGKTTGKAIKKLNEMSKPIYVKSIDDSVNQT